MDKLFEKYVKVGKSLNPLPSPAQKQGRNK